MAESASEVVRVRSALDAALLELRAVQDPAVPLLEAERELARSVAQLYEALASTHDATAFRKAVVEAARHAEEALGPLRRSGSSDPAVARSTASLTDAVRALSGPVHIPAGLTLDLPGPRKGRALVPALGDEPRLLDLRRGVLEPALPLTAPDEPPSVSVDPEEVPPGPRPSVEALLAEAQAAATLPESTPRTVPPPESRAITPEELRRALVGEALTEEAFRFQRARHFFEDLGTMGLIRRPADGAHWRVSAKVERRLLARVDAILACGTEMLPRLVRSLGESPLPDAELTWAAVLVHGMLAGDDAFDEVVRLVHASPLEDPAFLDSISDALRFLPHPRTEAQLQQWLGSRDGRLRRLGLFTLGRRGTLDAADAWRGLQDPDPEVRAAAAAALPGASRPLDDGQLGRVLQDADPSVVEAGLRSALLHRRAAGTRVALGLLAEGRGGFARAAVYAALSASEDARPVFASAWAGAPDPVLAEALGWWGDPESIDPLLSWAEQDTPGAVLALQRLTGASLVDPDVSPDDPVDEAAFGPGWRVPAPFEVLTPEVQVWRSWWTRHRSRAPRARRVRWGRLFSAEALLWEIDEGPFGAEDRRLSHLELRARTGGELPLEPGEFVARQAGQVAAWREWIRGGHALPAGTWTRRS